MACASRLQHDRSAHTSRYKYWALTCYNTSCLVHGDPQWPTRNSAAIARSESQRRRSPNPRRISRPTRGQRRAPADGRAKRDRRREHSSPTRRPLAGSLRARDPRANLGERGSRGSLTAIGPFSKVLRCGPTAAVKVQRAKRGMNATAGRGARCLAGSLRRINRYSLWPTSDL